MRDNNSVDTARIKALKTSMVSLLHGARQEPPTQEQVGQGAALLVQAFQDVFNLGSKQLVEEAPDAFSAVLRAVGDAYDDWRELDAAFEEVLSLAYNDYIPRDSLLLDATHQELRVQVGERLKSLHARLNAAWRDHLDGNPWDEYLAVDAGDGDEQVLEENLKTLTYGDHLDVEDAVEDLTGDLRYAFARYLENRSEPLDVIEESLWMRPEIVVINDYWRYNQQTRILDVLCRKGTSRRTGAFAKIQDFFAHDGSGLLDKPERIAGEIQSIRPEEKDGFLRCLMLHPDQSIRRYALHNIDIEGFWKVVTPNAVPCATILNMLERVAGSQNYDEAFQKVFFETIHKRLFNLTSRSEVIYARGIVRIFSQLPFFMEDSYFEQLMAVIDYLGAKERQFKMDDGILDDYLKKLRDEKDRIGTLQAQAPSLVQVPPVVLRKLARDGHFWYELAAHPMYKIAKETIPHVNSEDRALRVARNHSVNQDVLRVVGRKRSLFNTMTAKMALLTNPHTPPTVSMGYLMDLSRQDTEQLLRQSTVHPELRLQLQRRLTP